MALDLRRNAAWALLGQLVFAACHWGGLIILGRLAGPAELGRYALALAVVTPIMLFGGLQMRELQVSDAQQRHAFGDYFAIRLAGTGLAGMIVLAIALLGYSWQVGLPILLIGVSRAFEGLSQTHYGLAHRHNRLDLIAQSMMLRGVLGLLGLGIGYYLAQDLGIGLAAMAVAWALVWYLFDRRVTRRWRDRIEAKRDGKSSLSRRLNLAWTALPLGIALMLVTLNPNVPRYFIEAMVGLGALGLFTAMAQFVVAGRMLITGLCQAAFPRLADLYATGELAAFRLLLMRLMGVSLLPGLVGLLIAVAFGRELLRVVYGPQFAAAAELFPWIMLVGLVLYIQTPFGYGLTAMHQFRVQPLIFGAAVAVNAAGCWALLPRYGLLGATVAWLAAVACQFLLCFYVHWRCLRRPVEAKAAGPMAPDLS